jgi:hypothetical protein
MVRPQGHEVKAWCLRRGLLAQEEKVTQGSQQTVVAPVEGDTPPVGAVAPADAVHSPPLADEVALALTLLLLPRLPLVALLHDVMMG